VRIANRLIQPDRIQSNRSKFRDNPTKNRVIPRRHIGEGSGRKTKYPVFLSGAYEGKSVTTRMKKWKHWASCPELKRTQNWLFPGHGTFGATGVLIQAAYVWTGQWSRAIVVSEYSFGGTIFSGLRMDFFHTMWQTTYTRPILR